MESVLIKIVGIVILFQQIRSDFVILDQSIDDQQMNYVASCIAHCMQQNSSAVLSNCHKSCVTTDPTKLVMQNDSNDEQIRLICRETDALIIELRIGSQLGGSGQRFQSESYKESIFAFKLRTNSSGFPLQSVYLSDSPIVEMKRLQRDTSYTVVASIFNGNFGYRRLSNVASFRTLENERYVPQKVSKETINWSFSSQNDTGKLTTRVDWHPTEDVSCNYFVHFYAPHDEDYLADPNILKVMPFEHMTTDTLDYETEYVMEIHGANSKYRYIEGNRSAIEFKTPICWDFHGFDLQKCRPPSLTNIQSTYEGSHAESYRINVTWDMPTGIPDGYEVSISYMYSDRWTIQSQNVSGLTNFAYFRQINTSHDHDVNYKVQVVAFSKGGYTVNEITEYTLKNNENFKGQLIIAACILLPLIVLMSISFIFFVISRRNRMKQQIHSMEMQIRKLTEAHSKDEMEIKPSNVELYEVLGEGAFGIVRKGLLKPANKAIAVKMLKENAGIDDINGFLSEITLMKSVGYHENIVVIVGHSTKLYNRMMLLTEYCSEGNLLDYVRKFREAHSPEKFYLKSQTDAVPFESCEKSPEDMVNFNSQLIEKFTLKNKSIFPSKNELGIQSPELNMSNCIVNKLYDDHVWQEPTCEKKQSLSVTYENETEIVNKPKNLAKNGKVTEGPEVLLFVENQAYDLLLKSENGVQTDPFNKTDKMESTSVDQHKKCPNLTARDLLMFAKQIATGMDFLANNKIVHRDLAARNILVCADKTVKIADFGLSRDIYVDNIYMKSSAGRLPIKWIALESMTDQKYTSQSDIWSYGILLHEIVTLGSTPYPTVPVDCLLDYLKSGNRMTKPHNCSQEFYDLMYSCWHCEPGDRPNFSQILRKMEWFIHQSDTNGDHHIDKLDAFEWSKEPIKIDSTCSKSSYLKPL